MSLINGISFVMKRLFKKILVAIVVLESSSCFACPAKVVKLNNKNIAYSLSKENTKYVVEEEIDLEAKSITVPSGSTILFSGGCFSNGTLVGTKTRLEGNVKVDRLKGMFISPVASSYSTLKSDFEKLKMLLSLSVEELCIDEDYTISQIPSRIYSDIPCIKGKNITIDILADCCPDGKLSPFIFLSGPVKEISGMTLDFHNYACRSAIYASCVNINTVIERLTIKNIDIRHVSLSENTYIQGLTVVVDKKSSIHISRLAGIGMRSLANGTIGDSSGNISAVYVYVNKSIPASINITDCYFEELHNYDSKGEMVLEDTNGIYVHESVPYNIRSTVKINNIKGINYGKRLIKTDAANISICNVDAYSRYYDTLSAISLNNDNLGSYKNASIQNVSFAGTADYVIGSSIHDTQIRNVKTDINIKPRSFCTAILPQESCTVEHLRLCGPQQIVFDVYTNEPVVIKDVKYDDTMYHHALYAKSPIVVGNSNLSIADVSIVSDKMFHLIADYAPKSRKYSLAVSAKIERMNATLQSSSKDWMLYMEGNNHKWDVSLLNSQFRFEGIVRAPFSVQQIREGSDISLSVRGCTFVFDNIDDNTIPYGWFEVSSDVRLSFDNCKVINNSGRDFSKGIHGMYILNKHEQSTNDNLRITRCKIDNDLLSNEGKLRVYTKSAIIERKN